MSIKKLFRLVTVLAVTALTLFAGSAAYAAGTLNINVDFTDEYLGYQNFSGYKVYDGLVYSRAAEITNITSAIFGRSSAACITPGSGNDPIAIKHDSLADAGIPLRDIRYVRYQYYYTGDAEVKRPELVVKESEFGLTKERKAYAMETVVNDGWSYITFDFYEFVTNYAQNDGTLPEMVFYPFGQTPASELSSDDKLYICELSIWSDDCASAVAARNDGSLPELYPVYFSSGRADAVGEDPEIIFVEKGGSVVLPENPYTLGDYHFTGWLCSDGNVVYKPGEEVEVLHKRLVGGLADTSRTYFVANWYCKEGFGALPKIKAVPFSEYNLGSNGVVDQSVGGIYCLRTLNVDFDGIKTSKWEFLPDAEGSNRTISFDGWQWDSMPLDISHYKYCAFVYYWDTTSTRSYTPTLRLLGSKTDTSKALIDTVSFTGKQALQKNKWAVCGFDIDFVNNSTNNKYVRWDSNTIVNQVHFHPFGTGSYAKSKYIPETDALYIGDFIFFEEKPAANPVFNDGYIEGMGDGTFRPNDSLTNGQAALLLARVLGATREQLDAQTTSLYGDIKVGDTYFGAVAYLESAGVLNPSKGDKFYPDEPAARNSFTMMLLNALSGDTETESLNPNKIPESEDTGSISRAEAIVNINALLKGTVSSVAGGSAFSSPFADVSSDQWFFNDVAFAATRAVLYTDKNGNTAIADIPGSDPEEEAAQGISPELFAEAKTYVSTLDATTERRINEIRSTESEYTVKPGGTVYYVSSTEGDVTSPGTSESAPRLLETLSDVNTINAKPGDVILFKRGDVFIGLMTAKPGVTYSAYGYGDKPLLTRSPADIANRNKWELVEGTDNIWRYVDTSLTDVGGINLISSSGEVQFAYKEIPSYQDGKFWVRGEKGLTEYDFKKELDHNHMYFHDAQYTLGGNGELIPTNGIPTPDTAVGPVYLRCDEGNPGTVFKEIYFNVRKNVISCGNANGVTIDNLCIKYFGSHGIGAGTINNLTVRNCEIGYGGGSIQHYGKNNTGDVTRFGNGIEIYGGLTNYTIDNCYVYQIYDAGITHQISSDASNCHMEGVYYTNNVLTHSSYNIEYFMSAGTVANSERMMKDVYFTDNIVRLAGYGWGVQRPDSAPSNIKGWTHNNFCDKYVIEGNVFDRCLNLRSGDDYVIQVGTSHDNSTPYLKNNIFVQTPGRILMRYGNSTYETLAGSEENVLNYIAGDGNKLYFYEDDKDLYKHHVFWED